MEPRIAVVEADRVREFLDDYLTLVRHHRLCIDGMALRVTPHSAVENVIVLTRNPDQSLSMNYAVNRPDDAPHLIITSELPPSPWTLS